MLWSPDSVIAADIPSIAGLHRDSAIKVFLKLKPAQDEMSQLRYKVKDSQTIVLEGPRRSEPIQGQDLELFVFDGIEDIETETIEVSNSIVNDSVKELLDGYNVAIMAYGQNESGKTHAMLGRDGNDGLVQSTFKQLFNEILREEARNVDFTLSLSIVEVYCEEIRDLLALPDRRKPLKLRADSNQSTLHVKDLSSVTVSSLSETLSCLQKAKVNQNSGGKRMPSRASVIIKLSINQRNNDEEIVKASTLQMIDLASSDKVHKDSGPSLGTEDARKINISMDAIDNVARSLAGSKLTVSDTRPPASKHQIPYMESSLTQLLREVIGGNYRTTVLLTCSTKKEDEAETLQSLNFGANMRLIKNSVSQNKSGFNSKKILDLLMKDFSVERANYISRIEQLQNEMTLIRRKEREKDYIQSDILLTENSNLKAQVDSLSQLLNSDGKKTKDEEHSRILETLMEKCESVIQLQMKLDNECSRTAHLRSELEFNVSREQALEAMNLKLLHQLQENEDELKQVLASNFSLKQDLEKWQNLAATRLEKNESLESLLTVNNVGRHDDRNRRSSASSAGSFMAQIDENSQFRKSSWLFGHSSTNSRAMRQASVDSVRSNTSQELSRPKVLKNGLNLNAVSGDAESFHSK
ncbi:hypothetical protein HG536_0G00520 [Torulaspora globosa]|uniref:Kinesin motor domain-containing protein n=1 Tax=Torulaspora globosa TaxID=48254 RepID=A0A7G3ZL09_9SACH|nr:uncharacterized protein HG536_0G00520 [Torulaspora globosa]QLL34195.1 hypothetical protein HG536_0G00520 [Torulaspora globosa]